MNNFIAKKSLDYSIEIARKTTHLIVIGYSFPDFNKIIDQDIISKMTHLKYIYIQDPNPEKILKKIKMGDNLITQKIRDKEIKPFLIDNVDEFCLPYSYKK